jgi:hypothetical protein
MQSFLEEGGSQSETEGVSFYLIKPFYFAKTEIVIHTPSRKGVPPLLEGIEKEF